MAFRLNKYLIDSPQSGRLIQLKAKPWVKPKFYHRPERADENLILRFAVLNDNYSNTISFVN